MSTKKVIICIIITITAISAQETSKEQENEIYCKKEMCPSQGKHVRCGNNGNFANNCTGTYELVNMDKYIPFILKLHNLYRNYIAGGNLSCFHPATRMSHLTWNPELAENAEYNVRSCKFAHDECRSTKTLPYAGQNIYNIITSRLGLTIDSCIEDAVFMWFDECKDANHTLMCEYKKTSPQTGHWTLMMNDRHNQVGCACLENMLPTKRRNIIFCCNYSSTNIYGFPSYKPGPTASECKARHLKYNNLCNNTIDSNDLYWYF